MGYRHGKFIEASYTGQNTKQGDILHIRYENASGDSPDYASSMHVVLHSDNILMIKAIGIEVENLIVEFIKTGYINLTIDVKIKIK